MIHCPKCGQQQVSEEVRFCSRCGFKLGLVRALLADDGGGGDTLKHEIAAQGGGGEENLPRRKDLNVGASLMFVAAKLGVAVFAAAQGPPGANVFLALMVLLGSFAFILLFSHPLLQGVYKLLTGADARDGHFSLRRRDINWGATLMFIAALPCLIAPLVVRPDIGAPLILFGLPALFILILFTSRRLMSFLQSVLSEKEGSRERENDAARGARELKAAGAHAALNAAPGEPVGGFGAARPSNTSEMTTPMKPPSVTERTTNLLGNK